MGARRRNELRHALLCYPARKQNEVCRNVIEKLTIDLTIEFSFLSIKKRHCNQQGYNNIERLGDNKCIQWFLIILFKEIFEVCF